MDTLWFLALSELSGDRKYKTERTKMSELSVLYCIIVFQKNFSYFLKNFWFFFWKSKKIFFEISAKNAIKMTDLCHRGQGHVFYKNVQILRIFKSVGENFWFSKISDSMVKLVIAVKTSIIAKIEDLILLLNRVWHMIETNGWNEWIRLFLSFKERPTRPF